MRALATGPWEMGDGRGDGGTLRQRQDGALRQAQDGALGAVLTAAQVEAGFWLAEEEDFVYLYRRRKRVAVFSAHAATIEAMRQEAARPGDGSFCRWRKDEEKDG